jgi:hypothetical protein
MSTTTRLPGAVVTALTVAALAAPVAGAMPIRDASEYDAGHASTARAAAAHQDLRSPDARDAARPPFRRPHVHAGTPVFPTTTEPIARSVPATGDDGLPWLTIALGAGGALALGGVAAGVTRTTRVRARRSRVAA